MNKLLLLLFIFSIHQSVNAQSYLWAYSSGYSTYTHLDGIKKDHLDNFYLILHEDSMGNTMKAKIEKRNTLQQFQWQIQFSGACFITDVEINSSNHPVVVGYYMDTLIIGSDSLMSPFQYIGFIFEADENGNILRSKSYNPSTDEFRPVDLFIDQQDNLYLTAQITGVHGFTSFHKLDPTWQISQDEFNDNFEDRTFSHILVDANGNVFISGTCGNGATFDTINTSSTASYQNMLLKYDSSFNAQWAINREYITFDDNNGLGSDGQFLYWTFNQSDSAGHDSVRVVKVDYSGNVNIDVSGPLTLAFFPTISYSADSSGSSVLALNAFSKIFLYRYDDQLNINWTDTIQANFTGFTPEVRVDCHDSSFYLGSRYYGDTLMLDSILILNPNGASNGYDVFVSKWGYNLNVSIPQIQNKFSLQVYPNPVSKELNIERQEKTACNLSIIDESGKQVYFRKNVVADKIKLDLSFLSDGIYFIRIENANQESYISKFILKH